MSSSGQSYHPKDHGGLKKDGSRDSRVKDDNVTGDEGVETQSSQEHGDIYKPKEHGGLKKDGTRDKRVKDDKPSGDAEEEGEE
ncbi:hypothetical protein HDV00_007306 [Rhizophlyctis rosea]|nr:hypothetical protein HDV00_007306 [Rhizophlyctis rosea]